jgi:hypothetical protein
MNSEQNMHTLRVQLLAMSRLSQRALDYSIKGYELRNLDFSRQISASQCALEEHHRYVKELCRDLMNVDIGKASDARFAFAAASINTALHVTYTAAAEVAQDSMRLLECSGIHGCAALERMGQLVNRSIRLCIIALFEKDAAHAKTVLRHQESLRLRELTSTGLHPHVGHWAGAQGDFERSVIRSLGKVAQQAHEIAEAILFWLEGKTPVEASASDRHNSLELPSAQHQGAANLCYMQSKKAQSRTTAQVFPC